MGWFLPNNSTPNRDDVIDWLLWALFSSSRNELDVDEYREELNGYIAKIENALGKELQDCSAEHNTVRSMRITLDPVPMLHRPLLWYTVRISPFPSFSVSDSYCTQIVAIVDYITTLCLLWLGFKHYTPAEYQWAWSFPPRPILAFLSRRAPVGTVVPYWYRPHKSQTKLPLVFLHGIGVSSRFSSHNLSSAFYFLQIGLHPYIPFLRSIIHGGDSDVGILLPELLAICMHMTPRSVAPRPQMLASLQIILDSLRQEEMEILLKETEMFAQESETERRPFLAEQLSDSRPEDMKTGWDHVVLCAHSYGTFVSGWMIRECVDTEMMERSAVSSPSGQQWSSETPLHSRISRVILIDPIPILLSNPAVAYNFLYREPNTVCPRRLGTPELDIETNRLQLSPLHDHRTNAQSSSWFSSASAWQLWYFASRDADIARTLCRAFFWAEGGIWREELGEFLNPKGENRLDRHHGDPPRRDLAIFLGGMDQIIPAESIRRYLTQEDRWKERWIGSVERSDSDLDGPPFGFEGKLEVHFNPKLDHATIFDEQTRMEPLLGVVRQYIRGLLITY